MERGGKRMGQRLFEAGTRLVSRAAERVLADPRGQEAVARAVGIARRGKRRLEDAQERLMRAAGVPGRQEYQELAKQLARIKRKARDLAATLAEEGRGGPPAGGNDRSGE
jgi:hypothetical protein